MRQYWKVFIGNKSYQLSNKQVEFMKRENTTRGTTSFWFNKLYISYPHISSMEQVNEQDLPQIPADITLSDAEYQKGREKVAEIREKLVQKLKV